MRIKIPERGAESDLTSLPLPPRPLSLIKRASYYAIYLLFAATIKMEEGMTSSRRRRDVNVQGAK